MFGSCRHSYFLTPSFAPRGPPPKNVVISYTFSLLNYLLTLCALVSFFASTFPTCLYPSTPRHRVITFQRVSGFIPSHADLGAERFMGGNLVRLQRWCSKYATSLDKAADTHSWNTSKQSVSLSLSASSAMKWHMTVQRWSLTRRSQSQTNTSKHINKSLSLSDTSGAFYFNLTWIINLVRESHSVWRKSLSKT